MDNLMMNINPPNRYNKNDSELSETLKTLYALRQNCLSYMAYGENLGDGILSAPAVNCRATAYKNVEGKVLLFALKNSDEAGEIELDLTAFMPGDKHSVRILNEKMELQRELQIGVKAKLDVLAANDELVVIEIC